MAPAGVLRTRTGEQTATGAATWGTAAAHGPTGMAAAVLAVDSWSAWPAATRSMCTVGEESSCGDVLGLEASGLARGPATCCRLLTEVRSPVRQPDAGNALNVSADAEPTNRRQLWLRGPEPLQAAASHKLTASVLPVNADGCLRPTSPSCPGSTASPVAGPSW